MVQATAGRTSSGDTLPSSRRDNAATLAYGSARAPYSRRSTLRCSRVRNGATSNATIPLAATARLAPAARCTSAANTVTTSR